MRIAVFGIVGLLCLAALNTDLCAQNFLFKHPRQGGFKFVQHDGADVTNLEHFAGSGILAIGAYNVYGRMGWRHAKLKAGLTACAIGLLKEFEDGYREGWGRMDTFANQVGIVTFLLLSDYAHFTLGIEQLFQGIDDYGLGVRFFRFAQLTPLKASFGFFALYNAHRQPWVGVDTHFLLLGRSEVHMGFSMINLQSANRLNVKPNIGISFFLF
jgi:hypothetical protein